MRTACARVSLRVVLATCLVASTLTLMPQVAVAAGPLHFEKLLTIDLPGAATVVDMTTPDMTGDWRPDLTAVAAGTNEILIFEADANGGLLAPTQHPTVSEPLCLWVRDVDMDNAADCIVGEADGYVRVYFGKGDGTIDNVRAAFQYDLGGLTYDPAEVSMVRAGSGTTMDLVISIPSYDICKVVRLSGTPGSLPTVDGAQDLPADDARGIAVGSFVGDDFYQDIAVTQSNPANAGVAIFKGSAAGTFTHEKTIGSCNGPWDIERGFLNDNQTPEDFVVSCPSGGVIQVKLSDGMGGWDNTTVGVGSGWEPRQLAWGMFDTAGSTDMAVLSETMDAVAFFSSTAGAFERSDYELTTRADATELCGLYLNGDSRAEIAIGGGDTIEVFANLSWPKLTRWAGADRYETCVAVSQSRMGKSDHVVIATGEDFPDALAGGPLAGMLGGRLLLSRQSALPDVVADEVTRLEATKAYVLGGTAVLSEAIEDELKALGVIDVVRIAGSDRYGTARAVALEMEAADAGTDIASAFVATGLDFPDALAAGSFGGQWQMPVLLTKPDSVPSATVSALGSLGITKTYVLGGSSVVSPGVMASLPSPTRLAGSDRYSTARTIAEWGVSSGARGDLLVMATGADFPDALSVGAQLGVYPSPLLLTRKETLPVATAQYAVDHQDTIGEIIFAGGTGVISDDIYDQVLARY